MKIALLIDGENISTKYIDRLMSFAYARGSLVMKRLYADFSVTSVTPWKVQILKYNIEPMQIYHVLKGKSAADIALCIDALELCFIADIDTFIIATSDSDIASLILKLNKYGKKVIIAGESKSHEILKQACDEFFTLDGEELCLDYGVETNLFSDIDLKEESDSCETLDIPLTQSEILYTYDKIAYDGVDIPSNLNVAAQTQNIKSKTETEQELVLSKGALKSLINHFFVTSKGHSIQASIVLAKIRDIFPDFNHKDFGYKKFSQLIEGLGYKFKNNKISKG